MTTYHGGKKRNGELISKNIYDIVNQQSIKGYCEPFFGMGGVFRHIPDLFPNIEMKAGDINKSVIKMWQASQKGWVPPVVDLSKTQWEKLKYDGKSSPEKGFLGHLFAFRGIYFVMYDKRISFKRVIKSALNVMLIAQKLKKVKFSQGSYKQFSNLKGYVIYCDPPYKGVKKSYFKEFGVRVPFNHEEFWNWCREMAKNNFVFVSEYSAPDDFQIGWQKGKEKLYFLG